MFRLVRAAVDSQVVLAKTSGQRLARQAVFLGVGAIFGLFALALLHVAAFDALSGFARIAPIWSSLIIVGADLVVSMIALALGRSGNVDARTVEARMARDRALTELRNGFALAAVTGPAGRMAGRGAAGLVKSVFSRRRQTKSR